MWAYYFIWIACFFNVVCFEINWIEPCPHRLCDPAETAWWRHGQWEPEEEDAAATNVVHRPLHKPHLQRKVGISDKEPKSEIRGPWASQSRGEAADHRPREIGREGC